MHPTFIWGKAGKRSNFCVLSFWLLPNWVGSLFLVSAYIWNMSLLLTCWCFIQKNCIPSKSAVSSSHIAAQSHTLTASPIYVCLARSFSPSSSNLFLFPSLYLFGAAAAHPGPAVQLMLSTLSVAPSVQLHLDNAFSPVFDVKFLFSSFCPVAHYSSSHMVRVSFI